MSGKTKKELVEELEDLRDRLAGERTSLYSIGQEVKDLKKEIAAARAMSSRIETGKAVIGSRIASMVPSGEVSYGATGVSYLDEAALSDSAKQEVRFLRYLDELLRA